MNDTQSALERAIETLGAVEVAPERYAYQLTPLHPNHGPAWVTASAKALREMFVVPAKDAEASIRMPSWWSPEQRFYCKACKHYTPHDDEVCYCSAPCSCDNCGGYQDSGRFPEATRENHPCCCDRTALYNGELVTASLETGAEVPVDFV